MEHINFIMSFTWNYHFRNRTGIDFIFEILAEIFHSCYLLRRADCLSSNESHNKPHNHPVFVTLLFLIFSLHWKIYSWVLISFNLFGEFRKFSFDTMRRCHACIRTLTDLVDERLARFLRQFCGRLLFMTIIVVQLAIIGLFFTVVANLLYACK